MHRILVIAACLLATAQTSAGQEAIPAPKGAPVAAAVFPGQCVFTAKVCVAVPDVKKISTVVYGCKTKDFCLPACNYCKHVQDCFGPSGCDGVCAPGKCEHQARTKRVLLKKVVTKECPSFKCQVEERPYEIRYPTRNCYTQAGAESEPGTTASDVRPTQARPSESSTVRPARLQRPQVPESIALPPPLMPPPVLPPLPGAEAP